MKTRSVLVATMLFASLAAPAYAREQAIINQANPLDCTTRYYMRPVQLDLSSEAPPTGAGEHPAVVVKHGGPQAGSAAPAARPHSAMLGRRAQSTKTAQIRGEHLYP